MPSTPTLSSFPSLSTEKTALTRFALVNLGGKTLDLVEALEVRRDRDTLARADLGQLLGNLVTDLGRARRDIDLCAVDHKSVCDHQSDSVLGKGRERKRTSLVSGCGSNNILGVMGEESVMVRVPVSVKRRTMERRERVAVDLPTAASSDEDDLVLDVKERRGVHRRRHSVYYLLREKE